MGMFGSQAPAAAMMPYDPSQLSGSDKLMMAGAMLRDASSAFNGGDAQNVMGMRQLMMQRQMFAAQMAAKQRALAGLGQIAGAGWAGAPPEAQTPPAAEAATPDAASAAPDQQAAPGQPNFTLNAPLLGAPAPSAAPAAAQVAPQAAPTAQAGGLFGGSAPGITDPRMGAAMIALDNSNPLDPGVHIDNYMKWLQLTKPEFGGGERPGAPIVNKVTGKIVGYTPNANGNQVQTDAQGNPVGTFRVPGFAAAEADAAGQAARAKAQAESNAKADNEVQTFMLGGRPIQMTVGDFRRLKAAGAVPALGQGQSPGDIEYQKADAQNFAREVDAHGAPAIGNTQNARTVTEQALHLASVIQPNAWTEAKGHVAGILNAAGVPMAGKDANDISTYQALLPQVLRGTFTTFPRLDKEFHVIQQASANADTPQDAAKILLGTQAAVQGRNLAYSQFVANYNGPKSKEALTKAWMASPQANASVFADPIWRTMSIGGKPAVMVGSHPLKDGHVYGVFRPGTPYAQSFIVQ